MTTATLIKDNMAGLQFIDLVNYHHGEKHGIIG